MNIEDVSERVFERADLDLRHCAVRKRESGISPRFMDQKVTPDVLTVIAACIFSLETGLSGWFTRNEIWGSKEFALRSEKFFGKPPVKNESMTSEYDKFISQPLKTLAFAGVLDCTAGDRRQLHFRVASQEAHDILSNLAMSEVESYKFLLAYIRRVLVSSDLDHLFETYHQNYHQPSAFIELKDSFEFAYRLFMPARVPGGSKEERRRIFSKVLNILTFRWSIPGTKGGRQSKEVTLFADLLYNRKNFRDFNKPKNLPRSSPFPDSAAARSNMAKVSRAMGEIRNKYAPVSEVPGPLSDGRATQVHHIFPKSKFPEFAAARENLILLTASQHNTLAHPENRSSEVSLPFQVDCLCAKIREVAISESRKDGFYSRNSFVDLVNIGYGLEIEYTATPADIADQLKAYLLA